MEKLHTKKIILGIVGVLVYLYFSFAITNGAPLGFDNRVSALISGLSVESWGVVLEFFTIIGSTKGFVAVAILVLLGLLIRRKDLLGAGIYLGALVSGYLINSYLKSWHGRPRPVVNHLIEVDTWSFPSGNAMIGLILYALTGYFIVKDLHSLKGKLTVWAIIGIIVMLYGMSRVALNVHYPSDVVAGYAFGMLWLMNWIYIYEVVKSRK